MQSRLPAGANASLGPDATGVGWIYEYALVDRTGTRAVAIVRNTNGTFEPREVSLGVDLGDTVEVVRGLNEGDQVVASGQFLIDSEARLKSVLGAMAAATPATPAVSAASAAPAASGVYVGEGKVEKVDPEGITISHGPVPALKWPAMTMTFGKADPKAFPEVKPGDTVRFEFKEGGASGYELQSVQRRGSSK